VPAKLRTFAPYAPIELESLLDEMLAKSPDNRPPDAAEVQRRLIEIGRARRGDRPSGSKDQDESPSPTATGRHAALTPDAPPPRKAESLPVGPPVKPSLAPAAAAPAPAVSAPVARPQSA